MLIQFCLKVFIMSPMRRSALLLLLLAMVSLVRMEQDELLEEDVQRKTDDTKSEEAGEALVEKSAKSRCTNLGPRPAGARCADGYARWLPMRHGYFVPYSNVKVVYHISAEKCRELCWANGRCESADYRAQDASTSDGSCFLNNKGGEAEVYKSDDEHLITFECCDKDDCQKLPPRPNGGRCADGYVRWLPIMNNFYVPYNNVKVKYSVSLEKCRQLCWADEKCESADFTAQDLNTPKGSCFLNKRGAQAGIVGADDEHLITYECC